MPDTAVNRRRGTTAQHAAFTGIIGETTYNTDVKILIAHDGATPGGFPAAHLHVANIFLLPQTMPQLQLPNTTSAAVGGIYVNAVRAIHNFGTQNWFSGVGAGNLTLTGADNTGLGTNALAGLTSGARNVAVGLNALAALTIGTNNVAVGAGSLAANTSGGSNTAVGRNALIANLTGSHNTAIGVSALTVATVSDNTAVGSNALVANTTGGSNTALGRQALTTNMTGANNTAVGSNALLLATGSNNTAIGRLASGGTTGANNIALGFSAGDNLTTGSNNIIIGYDIDSPTATNSNTLTIGNLIFGTGVDGTGTTISNGLVGIRVVAPVTELHVVSTSALDPRGIMSAQHTGDTIAARIHLRKSRGTPTAPSTIISGDMLGRLRFSGYDSANYLQMGSIDVVSVGTIAATRVPTFMAFSTATDATPSVLTEGFRLTQAGTLLMATAKALAIASGTNQRAGNAVLVAGTVTVANTTVTANTIVLLTRKTSGGTPGTLITYTVTAATSFTINSDSALDTSTFSYLLIEVP